MDLFVLPHFPGLLSTSWPFLFVTESTLTLLAARQANKSGDEELRRRITLFGKPADQEDGRLGSPEKHLMGLDACFFYRTERGEGLRK